jgi:hypothetical protein
MFCLSTRAYRAPVTVAAGDAPVPRPLNREHDFWFAIVDRLDRQNEILADVRDRLPAPSGSADAGSGTVELTEPAKPAAGQAVEEPAAPAEQSRPKTATRKPTANKSAAKRTTGKTSKTTGGTAKRGTRSKPAEGNT